MVANELLVERRGHWIVLLVCGEVTEFIDSEVLDSIKFMDQRDSVILTRWRSWFE